ncbi:MAG: helix-hairpin-helix domain-containing protein [Halanaerobiales bacterium]
MIKLKKEQLILIVILLIVISGGVYLYIDQYNNNNSATRRLIQRDNYNNLSDKTAQNESDDMKVESEKNDVNYVVVHIAGEISRPGVYRLKEKSRVIDVLKMSGGETEVADLTNINLAAVVSDGQKIIIPGREANKNKISTADHKTGSQSETEGKINLNMADIDELKKLSGIGESRAQNILDHRNKIDKFTDIYQLLEIKGIGEKTLENIKDELTL